MPRSSVRAILPKNDSMKLSQDPCLGVKVNSKRLELVYNLNTIPILWGMRKQYPSDISRQQFNEIRPYLESLRKKTRPREVDLYDVFCAILYVLDSGCQWRMIPGDFPKWQTVYSYWAQWRKPDASGDSPLAKALKKSGVGTPATPGPPRPDYVPHRRFPKRAEYPGRTGQRL